MNNGRSLHTSEAEQLLLKIGPYATRGIAAEQFVRWRFLPTVSTVALVREDRCTYWLEIALVDAVRAQVLGLVQQQCAGTHRFTGDEGDTQDLA